MVELICPLCDKKNTTLYHTDKKREYYQCLDCCLVFVPEHFHLPPDAAKKEYDLHINSPDDEGYRKFLGRLFQPMKELLSPQSRGLDFGSGPGPTLSVMFEEIGHTIDLYDIFYAPDKRVFDSRYDFVCCSEVVEHLVEPRFELQRLWNCLVRGGYLGVMTKRVINRQAFTGWHYKNDLTHICFFSDDSVKWLSDFLDAELVCLEKDIFILKKK